METRVQQQRKSDRDTLSGKKIGLVGKGGAGKSTIVVLLAEALGQAGYPVCVLDADSTNMGLHRAFGIEQAPRPLLDFFGGMVFSGGAVTCPVDDPTPLEHATIRLNDLPGEYWVQADRGVILLAAGKLATQGVGAGCDGPIAKIARDIRVELDGRQPVTLVDFKAGFEDSARGVVVGLDRLIGVIDPTVTSLNLAADLKAMVDQFKSGRLPATRHLENPELVELANCMFRETPMTGVDFVLNRVPDEDTAYIMRRALVDHGIEPIAVIRDDPDVARSWLKGTRVNGFGARRDIKNMAESLYMAFP